MTCEQEYEKTHVVSRSLSEVKKSLSNDWLIATYFVPTRVWVEKSGPSTPPTGGKRSQSVTSDTSGFHSPPDRL